MKNPAAEQTRYQRQESEIQILSDAEHRGIGNKEMIRETEKEELPDVFELLKDVWLDTYVALGLNRDAILNMFTDKEGWVANFETYLRSENALSYVAIHENRIVGVIFGRKGRIRSLYLKLEFQGKGYGSRLLDMFIENGLPVYVSVLECNEKAQEFYKKKNFKPMGKYRYFKVGDKEYKDLEFVVS